MFKSMSAQGAVPNTITTCAGTKPYIYTLLYNIPYSFALFLGRHAACAWPEAYGLQRSMTRPTLTIALRCVPAGAPRTTGCRTRCRSRRTCSRRSPAGSSHRGRRSCYFRALRVKP